MCPQSSAYSLSSHVGLRDRTGWGELLIMLTSVNTSAIQNTDVFGMKKKKNLFFECYKEEERRRGL